MEKDFNFIQGQVRVFNTLKEQYKEKDKQKYKVINKDMLVKFLKTSQDL